MASLNFNSFEIRPNHVPVILFFISLLAYGVISPFLGFYQDDWHFIYYYTTRGIQGLVELFNYDGHPFSAWSYIIGFKLLGVNPIAWQLFSVFWRWLATFIVWKFFHQLWPQNIRQTFFAASFFLLYPAYILQPQAITYFEVWISHTVLFLSFYYAGKAILKNKLLNHVLGYVFKVIHIFTSLYVTGLEFIRPVIIWIQLSKVDNGSLKTRALTTLKLWLPYLLINVSFLIWRLFIYNSPVENRADPNVVFALINSPIETIKTLLSNLLPDLILILFSSWYQILSPDTVNFSRFVSWIFFALMVLAGATTWFLNKRIYENNGNNVNGFAKSAFSLGILFVIFGLTPYYAIGYFMHEKIAPWNGRVALGSIAGAGLLISLLIHSLISVRYKQNIVLAVLMALTVGWQLRSANEFRYAWEKQQLLYKQLSWRIPNLQKNTAIIAEQEILPLMGDYPTSFAVSTLYGKPVINFNDRKIPYWFFTAYAAFGSKEADLTLPRSLSDQQHSLSFSGQSYESIVIRFEPTQGECLWVLRPLDSGSKALRTAEQKLASISNLERIQQSKSDDASTIFPYPAENAWCYFYQKADLARQFNEWNDIIVLWDKAQHIGERPGNGFEYVPFIEAYAFTGSWDDALQLTLTANKVSPAMNWQLCPIWNNLYTSTPPSTEKEVAFQRAIEILRCASPVTNN